ncbi:DNA repair protein RecO [Sphingomonas sp. DBB INV C78]|uniref:DNA repair protein RecO n=1 Tax=Sphingomonas sp. DBB INV C78 TaxID=3349434 RepID=UPI0036D278D7
MHITATAIVCAVLAHGEHGAVVRLMTPDDGLQPGYVRGGRSRRLRPVLLPGNLVAADYRARSEDQLAALTVELAHSRAGLHAEPLAAAAIDWATALTASALPEGQPFPQLYAALDGLLNAIEAAPSARGWGAALARYELLLLGEMGFGLDLTACAVTDARDDLIYVSPKSGRAVSRVAGEDYRDKLLHLPAFLLTGGGATDWPDIVEALRLTGHFLARDILTDRRAAVLASRERLLERIGRLA